MKLEFTATFSRYRIPIIIVVGIKIILEYFTFKESKRTMVMIKRNPNQAPEPNSNSLKNSAKVGIIFYLHNQTIIKPIPIRTMARPIAIPVGISPCFTL